MKKFNLDMISCNRNTIYGIACMWIVLFHSTINFDHGFIAKAIGRIKIIGDCGVDVFLFVSGISLFFSIIKGHSLKEFYLRRLKRIILPTLCVTIPWFAFLSPEKPTSYFGFFMDITTLSFFTTGNQTFWFITAILILYAFYPVLYFLFDKTKHSITCLLIIISGFLIFNGVLHYFIPSFYLMISKLLHRIPIFIIGAYCGKYVYEKKQLPLNILHILFLMMLSVALAFAINQKIPDIIPIQYTYIPIAMCLTAIFSTLGNVKIIRIISSWFAPVSLEIYLCFERWLYIIPCVITSISILFVNLIAFILSVVTAYIILYITKITLKSKRSS